jgi:aminoglycoside phosphotransferase (APT) family kinase protein
MTNADPAAAAAVRALRTAGIGFRAFPVRLGHGCDNTAYTVTASDGLKLVVRVRTSGRSRYATARYAGRRAASAGLPVPQVLWHDDDACVETRLPGTPLDDPHRPVLSRAAAAAHAGALMRRWHALPATGFGPLKPDGTARRSTWQSWLLAVSVGGYPDAAGTTVRRAMTALHDHARRAFPPQPRLLHGDLVARHVLVSEGTVTGIVDLDSARAGDPLADIAGWTLRDEPGLMGAVITAYFPAPPGVDALTALAAYRVRIALSLLSFHTARGDRAYAATLIDCLNADLDDLALSVPHLLPRHPPHPRDPLHGGQQ